MQRRLGIQMRQKQVNSSARKEALHVRPLSREMPVTWGNGMKSKPAQKYL